MNLSPDARSLFPLRVLGGLAGFLGCGALFALPLKNDGSTNFGSVDSAPATLRPVIPTEAQLTADPGKYLREMNDDLRRGSLGRIATVAPALLRLRPGNEEVRAILCLQLAADGHLEQAKQELAKGRESAPNFPLAKCAEALLLLKSNQLPEAGGVAAQAVAALPSHPYPWQVLGRVQMSAGRDEEAILSFDRAIKESPEFTPAHVNLGALALGMSDASSAFRHFTKALELDPTDVRPRHGLALALMELGDLGTATRQFEEVLRRAPDFTPSRFALVNLQIRAGRPDVAEALARRMDGDKVPGAGLLLARCLMHGGKIDQARAQLDLLPADSPQVLTQRAICGILQGDHREALATSDKLLAIDPDDYGALTTRAVAGLHLDSSSGLEERDLTAWSGAELKLLEFLKGADRGANGKWPEAHAAFTRAEGVLPGFSVKGLTPDNKDNAQKTAEMPCLAAGLFLQLQGYRSAAETQYGEMIRINDTSPLGHFLMATCLLERQQKEDAMQHLERSLAGAPRFFPAMYALGERHLNSGDISRALDFLSRANQIVPTPGIDLKLGLIHESKGDFGQAETHYLRFVDRMQDNFVGYNQLAWLYASHRKNLDRAFELASKADTLQPGNASVLDTLGWLHFLAGRTGEAQSILAKANQINPSNATICQHLGAVLLATGSRAEGEKMLREAVRLSGDGPEAAEAKRLLKAPAETNAAK